MVSLMMYGTRVSLIVGFAAALVAMLIGGVVGVSPATSAAAATRADARHRLLLWRSPTCR